MTDLVQIVPSEEVYLTEEDLSNPDNEIIFVQHPEQMATEQVREALEIHLNKKHSKGIKLENMGDSPCYPFGFGDNEMHITRKFDKYYVAFPKDE